MAAQTGYYDNLKSIAGKVFSYLASITLTGTDGKTITCTQDTSLDEAVAMSSKAPKTGVIGGDGTAGRSLRISSLLVEDGTAANSVKLTLTSIWNGNAISVHDSVVGWSGDSKVYADAANLGISTNELTGSEIAVMAFVSYNSSGTPILILANLWGGTGILLPVYNASTGASLNPYTLVDTGPFRIDIIYITG